jgi:TRAP-type C4-dicarboxylate transport system substrate-binding protein
MQWTKRSFSKAALALGVAIASMPVTAMAQDVVLKLHQFLPAQANVPRLVLDVWADKVQKDSGGRIKIERFAAMQLGGKPPELYDQAKDGLADIIWTVNGYTPGRFPRSEVFELPFMMTNAEAVSRAYWDMFVKHMKDTEFAETKIIGTWVHGPGMFHTKNPVKTPDDLKGMKIRGGSRVINNLLEKVGAQPVGLPVTGVPEALSKGVIDGTTIPWEVTTALKVPELVKNHTEFSGKALYTITFVLAMNKAKYDGLPADLKKVIDDNSGQEFSAFAGKTQAGADGPARENAVKAGNNIVTISEADTAKWRELSQPVYDQWATDVSAKGIDGKALIKEAQDLIAKYTK